MNASIEAAKQIICAYTGRGNKLHYITYSRASMPGQYSVSMPDSHTVLVEYDMNGKRVMEMYRYSEVFELVKKEAENELLAV